MHLEKATKISFHDAIYKSYSLTGVFVRLYAKGSCETSRLNIICYDELIMKAKSIKEELLSRSSKLDAQSDEPIEYGLPMDEVFCVPKLKVRKMELGPTQKTPDGHQKVLLLVGEVGSGKTTFINAMINYLLGVNYEDNYRFKITYDQNREDEMSSKTSSQSQWITSYTIYTSERLQRKRILTIIDTPGFKDPSEAINGKTFLERLGEFLSSKYGIDHVDAVGFVMPSSIVKLSEPLQYLFNSLRSLFANDFGENIYILITFADANDPPVLEALKEANISYKIVKKFNNSAVFAKRKNQGDSMSQMLNKMYWDLSSSSLDCTLKSLLEIKPKILPKTVPRGGSFKSSIPAVKSDSISDPTDSDPVCGAFVEKDAAAPTKTLPLETPGNTEEQQLWQSKFGALKRAAEERVMREGNRVMPEKPVSDRVPMEKKEAKNFEKLATAEANARLDQEEKIRLAEIEERLKAAEQRAADEKMAREKIEEQIAKEKAESERKAAEEKAFKERQEAAQKKEAKKRAKAEKEAAKELQWQENMNTILRTARMNLEAESIAARQAAEEKAAMKVEKKKKKAQKEKEELERQKALLIAEKEASEQAARDAEKKRQEIIEKQAEETRQMERLAAEEKAAKEKAERDKISAKNIMMMDLLQKSVKCSTYSGSPKEYEVLMDQVVHDQIVQVRKLEFGNAGACGNEEKVIMIVGETGSGKTTLINSMVNYIVGVDYDDDFRFKIITDIKEKSMQATKAKSQTQWVTSYTFYHREGNRQPFAFTLVDTPGFGDTGGIIKDREIVDRIRGFFSSPAGIDHLDAIGFVVPSSVARLTPTQRYVFDSVLALFGKDVADNIYIIVTFADANVPPVLESLKEANINYSKYIKLNNSAFFAKTKGDGVDQDTQSFNRTFWDMGIKSFDRFFNDLTKMKPRSLTLTKQVLHERHVLQTHLIAIKFEIDQGLRKLNQLENELAVIKTHKADLDRNKNFTYTVVEEKVIKEDIPEGTYITNCLKCNRTCHYPCQIPDDAEKSKCAAMTNGSCHVCKSGCDWSVHKNMQYKFTIQEHKVTKTAEDLLNRYRDAEGKLLSAEPLAQKVYEEFLGTTVNILRIITQCKECLQRLQEIALKPDPLSEVDYIDRLIEAEQMNKTDGYAERIKQLTDIRGLAACTQDLQNDEILHKLVKNEERVKSKFPSFITEAKVNGVLVFVKKGASKGMALFK